MLKLKGLRLRAVGRFVEPQHIDFASLGSLTQVDGQYVDTKGSSGSGKTTLFNALDFLLGLNDLPTTVLQSRLTKEKMSVEGDFDWDGKNVTIARAAKLSIEVDGVVTTGSSALSEAKLDEILGMPRVIFRKILHKRQKEGGFFLDFTPKKMYEFLTDVLNLSAERKKLEKVESKLSELDTKKTSLQNSIATIQSALTATQEGILTLGLPPVRDIHQSVIIELKGKYDAATQKLKEIEERHRQETRELEESRPKTHVSSYDTSTRDSLDQRRKAHESNLGSIILAEHQRIARIQAIISAKNLEKNQVDYCIREAEAAKKSAAEFAGQIKKIRDAICPTCEQGWVTETAKTKENEILAKLAIHKEKIVAGAQAVEREKLIGSDLLNAHQQLVPFVDPQIAVINTEIAQINSLIVEEKQKAEMHNATQNAANSSILQHFATKQTELRSKHFQEANQFRGQVDVDRRTLEAAVAKLKSYEDARIRYENSLHLMKEKEKETDGKLSRSKDDLRLVEEEIEKAEELKKIVKSFISCSFDDALESIGDAATKIIRCIPTMSNATIQFEAQKETQDGKVKEEVNAVISMDGDIGIPIKSLSGGERSSTDLVVDLAVIDFIESESGKGIDVFILDEPFTGLDTVSIEMALEVLKNSSSSKKLIVVDHNPEVKQLVSNRLVVVREGSTSNIISQEVMNG